MDGERNDATFEELTRSECLAHLAQHTIGRFAVALPDSSPLVVPVTYVLDGEAIVFRSGSGAKVDALHHRPVSFEVDDVDVIERTGWSVLVKGTAYEATHWEVGHLAIEPWAPGTKPRWVRIVPNSISGRRIVLVPCDADARGYL